MSTLIDFGKAAINAINNVFRQTLVKGCHFHFARNVWEKVTKIWFCKIIRENIRHQTANIISLPMVLGCPESSCNWSRNASLKHLVSVIL